MGTRLNPYLNFDGDAREAMEFYASALGGSLELTTFGEYGDPQVPEADRIMHGMLATDDDLVLMGADLPPGESRQPGNDSSVSLSGDDADRLRGIWTALADGATVQVPLEQQMWGDEFGMLRDRYGVSWLVNISAGS